MRQIKTLYKVLLKNLDQERMIQQGICKEITQLEMEDIFTEKEELTLDKHLHAQEPSEIVHPQYVDELRDDANGNGISAYWWDCEARILEDYRCREIDYENPQIIDRLVKIEEARDLRLNFIKYLITTL